MIFNENGIILNESKNNIEWKYVNPIKNPSLIKEFEKQFNFKFPNDYKNCVLKYNDGSPSKYVFDTNKTKERVLKSLLSFNKDDSETIWFINNINDDKYLQDTYIIFAIDVFGNRIAFKKDDKSIYFIDHETNNVEYIADSFTSFINSLY